MSLQVWLPFTDGTFKQQGLTNIIPVGSFTSENIGKLGKCIKTNEAINLMYDGVRINTGDISFGGWFKINKAEIQSVLGNYSFNSTHPYATGQLIGNSSYKGIGLVWTTNNIATAGSFNTIYVCSHIRTAAGTYASTNNYTFAFDTWTHIFLTFNRSSLKLKLYINGVLFHETAVSSFTDAPNNNLYLSYSGIYGGNGPGRSIPLHVNDVRIYDHCLSPMEVKELAKGLVLHYPLNRQGWGQENVLKGTDTGSGWLYSTFDVSKGVFTRSTTSTSESYVQFSGYNVPVEAGVTYTLSCYAKSNGFVKSMDMYKYNSSVQNIQYTSYNLTTDYKLYTFTFIPQATENVTIRFDNNGSTTSGTEAIMYIKHPKLEKGSIATPWCPNSSDILATIIGLNSTIEYDCSGFCNNGEKMGALTYTSDTPKYNVATYCPAGTGIFGHPNITFSQFTIAFWGKHSATGKMLMGSNASTSSVNTNWYWYGDNSFKYPGGEFYYSHNAGSADSLLNKWTHFVATYDGANVTVYRNGIYEGVKALTGTQTLEHVSIGNGYSSSSYWENGYVSDLRIYATALSADDVKSLYQNSAYIDSSGNVYGAVHSEV